MKNILSIILLSCCSTLTFVSCMGDVDDPNTDGFIVTSPTSIGEVNSTIGEVKSKYCAGTSPNTYTKVSEDMIIEGVVVANDEAGNLYQTLMLRNIDPVSGEDQSIVLAIKNTCLYPYFPKGQRLKINLNGLYAGCYSKVPKIGQPYKTSSGNLRLGPMLLELCKTNIELVGQPDLNAPELIPVDFTNGGLEDVAKTYKNVPMLATVKGKIAEVQNGQDTIPKLGELTGRYEPIPKILGPEQLHDAGFGVDRKLALEGSKGKMTIRTSTKNPVSYLPISKDTHTYTGMLTYYKDWQLQLRNVDDIDFELKK